MPVEKFSGEGETAQSGAAEASSDEGVLNTGGGRALLGRLKIPAGVGVALALVVLAYFLLTGHWGRPKTGSSGGDGTLVLLEPQTISLAEPGTRLDVRIVLEASSTEFSVLLRRRTAQLADIAITVISTKRIGELDSELERNRLKRELADAIGQRLRSDDAHITNVYFTRFYYRSK